MNKIRKLFKKEEKFEEFLILSYEFPEGIVICYKLVNGYKDFDYYYYFNFNLPIYDLVSKYKYIKPKILKTVKISKHEQLYEYIRKTIDECGYKPYRILNKDISLFGFNDDDVIKKKKI